MAWFLRRAFAPLLLLVSSAAASQGMSAGGAPQLLVTPNQAKEVVAVPGFASPGVKMSFNAPAMLKLRHGETAELTLPDASRHPFVVDLVEAHPNGIKTWTGRHRDLGNRHRAIVTTGPSGSWGYFSTPEGEYRLVPGPAGDVLIDMKAEGARVAPDVHLGDDVRISPVETAKSATRHEPHAFEALAGVNSLPMTKAAPATGYVVDIMFVVTKAFSDNLKSNLLSRLQFLVARANAAYADSDVGIRLRYVHHVVVNYTDANDNGTALDEITPGCKVPPQGFCTADFNAATFGNIETLRTTHGADLVAVLRDGDNTGGSGIAWLGQRNGGSTSITNPTFMYSVTTGCVRACEFVFIHEVGHNMGLNHDRATYAWQAGGIADPPAGQYHFGHYYCASGTLSCNPNAPDGCKVGEFDQQPECSTNHAHNFSDLMAYFHGTTYNNYVFANPNLQCKGDRNGPSQPCGIANMADGARYLNEVRAALSAIKGSPVTYTDGTPTATNWPPANAMPPGFSSSGNAWTVATDRVYEGTHSLGSAQVYSPGPVSNPPNFFTNSDLTYTGEFTGGTVSFMYQVSGLSWYGTGFGVFEFSIDGVVVLADTGESGWQFFSHPITAGNHTLRWRFKNASDVACTLSLWSGPPNTTADCVDRAWIDALSMPSAAPASYQVTVSKTGTGAGTVTSAPAGISCGATCAATLGAGNVTLTATPTGGSVFTGWTADVCSGTGTCAFTLSRNTAVTASFTTAAGSPTGFANPSTLAFGGQSVQTSRSLPVVLTNIGTGTLTVTGVTSDNALFTRTHNCTSLTQGQSCTAVVTYKPTAASAASGNLTFQTSAGNVVVPLSGTGELSLVKHFYRAILNRAPEPGGQEFWEAEKARLTALGANINEVWFVMANYFFNSPEYRNANKSDTQFLTDVYNTFFNRAPDGGGMAFWQSQLDAGLSREGVIFWFMFSNEFKTFTQGIFGNTAARPEVDLVMDLFRGILNRFPDTPAFNAFVGSLRTAQCQGPGQVYKAVNDISYFFIFGSGEYTGRNRTNTQYVSDMYNAFLRRGGADSEVDFWINQLDSLAKDRNRVRADFMASPEFGSRVNAVIAAGCLP